MPRAEHLPDGRPAFTAPPRRDSNDDDEHAVRGDPATDRRTGGSPALTETKRDERSDDPDQHELDDRKRDPIQLVVFAHPTDHINTADAT